MRLGFRGVAALGALVVPTLVFAAAGPAAAGTVVVNCNAGKTIRSGLSQLAPAGPSVLKIIGTCRENVSISGFHNLQVVAAPGAELLPAPSGPGTSWVGTYVLEVVGSSSVTIKGLTVHAAGAQVGMSFRGCVECFVKDCSFDGSFKESIAFSVGVNSSVRVSDVRVQDRSGFYITDNSTAWIEGFELDGNDTAWAGIMAAHSGVAYVRDSVFRHAGVGLHAFAGGTISASGWFPDRRASSVTIQNNSCGGVVAGSGASFSISDLVSVLVSDNGSESCPWAGVWVGPGGRADLLSIEVRNEHGPGISLSGQSQVSLGGGIKVTGNLSRGLEVLYDSIALGPPTGETVLISGNGDDDLWCDDSSRITGMGHFPGAVVNCPNFVP